MPSLQTHLATVCMWGSKDKWWKPVLSFYHVGPGIQLWAPGLAASTFLPTECLIVPTKT